jgi:dihydroorotate dehydrogenase
MDLTTRYLGMNLRTPLVPSASPLSDEVENIKRMEDAGASAVVLHSLFEEQVKGEQDYAGWRSSMAGSRRILPQPAAFTPPRMY